MKNQIQIFENTEFGKVRVITIGAQPWFVGIDVAGILGYTNSRKALSDHVDAEDRKTVTIRDGIPGNPNKTVINESGLYSLILSSKLPQAKAFKRWVTNEILPVIRKHGVYATQDTLDEMLRSPVFAEELIRTLAEERKKTATLEELTQELAPKALYFDEILHSRNAVPVSLISKDYGYSAIAFNRLLHELGIQYPLGGTWLLYQDYAGMGYTQTHTYRVSESTSTMHTCWTQKGRLFLYETLKSRGILPQSVV